MVIILLNMGTMTLDHYDMSKTFENVLDYVNNVFVVIFTLECAMKLIAFRLHYFRQMWNVFDFLVVITSLLGTLKFTRPLAHKPPIFNIYQ